MYLWFVFVHLIGLVLFVALHGVSMVIAFRIRSADVPTARLMLGLSTRATQFMYVGLVLLGIGGLAAAWEAELLLAPWVVASYIVLAIVIVAMYAIAAGLYYPLRDALDPKEGEPISAAELTTRLDNRRPELLAAIGGVGLVVLVWLMVLKPGA